MKLFFIVGLLIIQLSAFSQNDRDTLDKNEERLLRMFGGLLKETLQKQVKEIGADKGFGGVAKKTIGAALKRTIEKTGSGILQRGGGFGDGSALLPSILNGNKEQIIAQGKGVLLDNFKSSMRDAANQTLSQAIPTIVAKSLDFEIDSLIKFANSDNMAITDVFKNANRNMLVNTVYPLAKKSFKNFGGKRLLKKINKIVTGFDGNGNKIDPGQILAETVVDDFFKEMKIQEENIRKNPVGLLGSLIDIIK